MRPAMREPGEWIDGFLFISNRMILDFLNTKPVLEGGPTELLTDVAALERWLIASGLADSPKTRISMRGWRQSPHAEAFLKELIAFRERLRDAVLRIEAGNPPSAEFVKEVNARLQEYPVHMSLRWRHGSLVREPAFEPRRPSDFWAPLIDGAAVLLAEPETSRIRKCEACVVHFFDTSKKGSRRWCRMNICGNKVKVAAYQQRKRSS